MQKANGQRLYIQEVSVRDGFQIESRFVPTEQKIDLINGLSRTGLAKIEVTSFTSPKAIPALADAEAVMRGIERIPGVEYAALVPNIRGAERALDCGVDELNLVMSASETHNAANLRMTPAQSLAQFAEIVRLVDGRKQVNASLSTAFGCPFEGDVPDAVLLALVERIAGLGIARVTLCDTTGMAHPGQVERLCRAVKTGWPQLTLTAHFHDTRAMGLANALAALEAGIDRFDASLGGLGGCPFAPGASGNVCTEDLVHMFEAMGYRTGVNLEALLAQARRMPEIVGHDVPGQVMKAGPSSRRYPVPDGVHSREPQQRLAGVGCLAGSPASPVLRGT
ncbi:MULTISPECIES: hydroxymethylglutaryl-CoA lyase [Pseudomonadota]|uniref:Hydroxymethylglutaryl-CoA lyase n=3 Tax=root TaxID=1 RepID=A0AAJ5NE04_9BURK|nr:MULTISPECIES: hydroxymethylglutaryl-CoA lyase [Pseudomonadota]BCX54908.1 hydroxymethylglutaryl-CoA lyase [Comamonas testosteroni]GGH66205.1 hydroxymethylglutaryl-CoA lyase [Comamonas phosphati]AIO76944.1 HMGL-like family protein [Burkholderia multivorans]KGG89599.1 hydroxymethylglutaryl-CoA lyase [Comamonas thiooxydans]KGG97362.1 hydroxymethylglutaryl-CoA lyase [Comamonas thiooxydans]